MSHYYLFKDRISELYNQQNKNSRETSPVWLHDCFWINDLFEMPMEVPEYEEEAAYGAALTVGKLVNIVKENMQ